MVVCAVHARPSTDSRALLTNHIRTCIKSLSQRCNNVVLPFFHTVRTFLYTNQLISRLQVVVMTNFMRMLSGNMVVNVFKSDAVFWWAAIFRTTSSMFDKLLDLSKSQSSATSRLRSHDLREAISNLLTVSMHLQDKLSKFHRPGLHKVDFCVHVASASTRTL